MKNRIISCGELIIVKKNPGNIKIKINSLSLEINIFLSSKILKKIKIFEIITNNLEIPIGRIIDNIKNMIKKLSMELIFIFIF